jgi:HEPN domain-containing protein
MTASDEFDSMIEKSRRFLLNADRNMDEEFIDIGVFSVNPSLEVYLKALLLKESGDYLHIHDMKILLRNLADLSNVDVNKKVELLFKEKGLFL